MELPSANMDERRFGPSLGSTLLVRQTLQKRYVYTTHTITTIVWFVVGQERLSVSEPPFHTALVFDTITAEEDSSHISK